MMHTLICRDQEKWVVYTREDVSVQWSLVTKEAAGRLQQAVEASLRFDPAQSDWTFSERQAAEVISIVEEPSLEHIALAARGLDVTVYCREGRFEDATDRWARVNVDRGRLWSGFDWVFQAKSLRSNIAGFFGFDDERIWKAFIRGKAGIDRPTPRMRELWVRPTWRARQLAPESFPAVRTGPVVTPAMAAQRLSRMPQTKSAVRRAKQAENLMRFRAEAAERARLRGEVA